jgi:hypothetical protein
VGALEIVTKFVADTSGLEQGAEKAKGAIGGIGDAFSAIPVPIVAGAAVAVTAIAAMTTAAAEDRAEQDKLINTYKNVGISIDEANVATQKAIDLGADKAFSDSEVRDGLTGLITATGDADEANQLLAVAMDIAREKGIPLADAADAVAKAHEGQDTALRKLFPGMAKQANAADTITEATKLSAGAADAYAQTAEGMGKKGSDAFGELGETVGSAFLPIMDALVPAIVPFVELLGELLKLILPPLKVAIGLVVDILKIMVDVVKKVSDAISTVVGWISNKLGPALTTIQGVIKGVGDAFGGVIDWIKQLLDWFQKIIDKVGSVIDNLNPLKGFSLPSLPFSVAAAGGPAASSRSGRATSSGTINVHVYGGDPRRVVEAVKEGYRRWILTGGTTAPDRDW